MKIRHIMAEHSAKQFHFVNRKFWEWCAIFQALDERDMIKPGRTGLGFAVGTEPLASYFASRGVCVLATDLAAEASDNGWLVTNQHAASKNALFQPSLVNADAFERLVTFQSADMRTLEGLSPGYDCIWSSCALEHLGNLQLGMDVIVQSGRLLNDGGVAVHTTEYNVKSDSVALEDGPSVIYRRRDILALAEALNAAGLRLISPDFDAGDHQYDLDIDTPPYMQKPHLKLAIGDFVCTSMLLIIENPGADGLAE